MRIAGCRNALALIHDQGAKLPVSEESIRCLHRLTRGEIWDAGEHKQRDSDIIERHADGGERVRFRTVSPAETPGAMLELIGDWQRSLDEAWIHPLIALAAFNLDFLCIHPFRDGNGRVSRLLLQCYHLGHAVGRYISLERLIEQNKARYYETLEQSSQRWHEGHHDRGLTSTMSCSSSKAPIGNWWSGLATWKLHAGRRPNRCWRLSNACHGSSPWRNSNRPAPA